MSAVLDSERPTITERHRSTTRLALSPSPTLIFEVDAGEIGDDSSPPRRFNVRLVGSVRNRHDGLGLTGSSDPSEVSAVLIIRALTPTRLLSCVRAVTRGGASVPPDLLAQLMPQVEHNDPPGFRPEALASRELSVLRMLADGLTTREIAEDLNYSERTVKNIVRGVLEKLNCRTRAHAVALATRHGVI